MRSSSSVVVVLWIVWLASWFLASGWTTKTVTQQSPGSRILQSLPVWIGALLLIRTPRGALAIPLYPAQSSTGWLAVALTVLGLSFTWWARLHLGRLWSSAVTLKEGHSIVRSGPYAITRHPIYTGILFAILASALARNSIAGVLGFGCITLGLTLKLRQEEEFLERQFGQQYDAYKKDVPALIPRPW